MELALRIAGVTGAALVYVLVTGFFFVLAIKLSDFALMLSGGRRGVQALLTMMVVGSLFLGLGMVAFVPVFLFSPGMG